MLQKPYNSDSLVDCGFSFGLQQWKMEDKPIVLEEKQAVSFCKYVAVTKFQP